MPLLCFLLTFLSGVPDQHKLQCMPLSNATGNLPSLWKVATGLLLFFLDNLTLSVRMILFQCSLCFQLLYSVALWHGVQAALYRAIKAWRVAAGSHRGGDRLLMKLMHLSHCEKVPTIFVLGTGLLETDVIHRIWRRNVNWCVKYSSFHSVKAEFLQHLK